MLQGADALSALDVQLLEREFWSLGERLSKLIGHLWHRGHACHIGFQLAHEVLWNSIAQLLLKEGRVLLRRGTLSDYGHPIDFLDLLNLRRHQEAVDDLLSLKRVAEGLSELGRLSRDLGHLERDLCLYFLVYSAHFVKEVEQLLLLLLLSLDVLCSFGLCCYELLEIVCLDWSILIVVISLSRWLLREQCALRAQQLDSLGVVVPWDGEEDRIFETERALSYEPSQAILRQC